MPLFYIAANGDKMSVLKNKRKQSRLEFFHNAYILRNEITLLLLRDFGIKDKIRTVSKEPFILRMDKDDQKVLIELFQKYNITELKEKYPMWLIEYFRNSILEILKNLILNITAANTIYPTFESEYYERRNLQNKAIYNCEQLLQEMQFIISIMPTNVNKYMRYVKMTENEIALLKGWRKSDNKILKRIKENSK